MERETTSTSSKLRAWSWVGAVLWAVLGIWSLADGDTWLGVAELVFAAVMTAASLSSRVAALASAPPFRRK
jgi:hypothetical protein